MKVSQDFPGGRDHCAEYSREIIWPEFTLKSLTKARQVAAENELHKIEAFMNWT